jgi:hypothetical protein
MKRKSLVLATAFLLLLLGTVFICAQEATSMRVAYTVGGYAEYIGKAAPGAAESDLSWQICKLTYDGSNNVTSRVYANGNYLYSYSWTLRATYDYTK